MLKTSRIAIVAIVFLSVGAGCRKDDITFGNRSISVGDKEIRVELALTPAQMARGLQRRRSLPPDEGMLFVYSQPVRSEFWMKDTLIPLSIAFIDGKGRILDIQEMVPDDGSRRYRSPLPYLYALELNRGWFKKNGVGVGDRVILDN